MTADSFEENHSPGENRALKRTQFATAASSATSATSSQASGQQVRAHDGRLFGENHALKGSSAEENPAHCVRHIRHVRYIRSSIKARRRTPMTAGSSERVMRLRESCAEENPARRRRSFFSKTELVTQKETRHHHCPSQVHPTARSERLHRHLGQLNPIPPFTRSHPRSPKRNAIQFGIAAGPLCPCQVHPTARSKLPRLHSGQRNSIPPFTRSHPRFPKWTRSKRNSAAPLRPRQVHPTAGAPDRPDFGLVGWTARSERFHRHLGQRNSCSLQSEVPSSPEMTRHSRVDNANAVRFTPHCPQPLLTTETRP